MARQRNLPTRVYRILIVDDHPIVRQGYLQLISTQPDLNVCGEADSEPAGLRLARETKPDLAIVDISLEGGNGIDLIKQLKAQQPKLKMLAASAHEEALFAERSLRAGAKGFINKKAAVEHLITAIRRVLDGEIYLSEKANTRLLGRLSQTGKAPDQNPIQQLSDRELEAYELIGQGLTTSKIAERMHVAGKTVDRYREKIKEKLTLENANELLRHATQWVLENR